MDDMDLVETIADEDDDDEGALAMAKARMFQEMGTDTLDAKGYAFERFSSTFLMDAFLGKKFLIKRREALRKLMSLESLIMNLKKWTKFGQKRRTPKSIIDLLFELLFVVFVKVCCQNNLIKNIISLVTKKTFIRINKVKNNIGYTKHYKM